MSFSIIKDEERAILVGNPSGAPRADVALTLAPDDRIGDAVVRDLPVGQTAVDEASVNAFFARRRRQA